MLSKLMAISRYFNVSLDSILSGETIGGTVLEKRINNTCAEKPEQISISNKNYTGRIIAQFNSLTDSHKERLVGYLEALLKMED